MKKTVNIEETLNVKETVIINGTVNIKETVYAGKKQQILKKL